MTDLSYREQREQLALAVARLFQSGVMSRKGFVVFSPHLYKKIQASPSSRSFAACSVFILLLFLSIAGEASNG